MTTEGTRVDENEIAERRWDRIAPLYDFGEGVMEVGARRWRRELWRRASGTRILELGIGTGKNLRFHPAGHHVVGIDISKRMLDRARRRAAELGSETTLEHADAQRLPYPDASFDTAVASFLLCSVSGPRLALQEIRRVLVPGGRLLLLEHVLSRRPVMRRVMRWLDPLLFLVSGSHIDRETADMVRSVGFVDTNVTDLLLDVVELIEARAPRSVTRERAASAVRDERES